MADSKDTPFTIYSFPRAPISWQYTKPVRKIIWSYLNRIFSEDFAGAIQQLGIASLEEQCYAMRVALDTYMLIERIILAYYENIPISPLHYMHSHPGIDVPEWKQIKAVAAEYRTTLEQLSHASIYTHTKLGLPKDIYTNLASVVSEHPDNDTLLTVLVHGEEPIAFVYNWIEDDSLYMKHIRSTIRNLILRQSNGGVSGIGKRILFGVATLAQRNGLRSIRIPHPLYPMTKILQEVGYTEMYSPHSIPMYVGEVAETLRRSTPVQVSDICVIVKPDKGKRVGKKV